MPELKWDQTDERLYEIGVDKGVLFVYNESTKQYGAGVAWNGLTEINEAPEGAEATDIYADNAKYITLRSAEDFKGTINAYTYPQAWNECDGSMAPTGTKGLVFTQQTRKTFALSYRTKIGNDTSGDSYGYKIHIVYGATAAPSSKDYQTINDSPDAMTLSWEFSTVPINLTGYKPMAHAIIDSTTADEDCLAALEAALYGTDGTGSGEGTTSRLVLPAELITMLTPATPGP